MDLYIALLIYKTIQSLKSMHIRETKLSVIKFDLIYTETPPLLRKEPAVFIKTRVLIQNLCEFIFIIVPCLYQTNNVKL